MLFDAPQQHFGLEQFAHKGNLIDGAFEKELRKGNKAALCEVAAYVARALARAVRRNQPLLVPAFLATAAEADQHEAGADDEALPTRPTQQQRNPALVDNTK